jgi:hypothetical protein
MGSVNLRRCNLLFEAPAHYTTSPGWYQDRYTSTWTLEGLWLHTATLFGQTQVQYAIEAEHLLLGIDIAEAGEIDHPVVLKQ